MISIQGQLLLLFLVIIDSTYNFIAGTKAESFVLITVPLRFKQV